MRQVYRSIPLLSLLLFCTALASAQSTFDVNIGFGSARASSTGLGIDDVTSPTNPFGSCSLSSGDSFCLPTPSLGGFFMGFGGDLMFQKHFGFGAEVDLRPARGTYGPLQYRQTFYDFDGIFAPYNEKRVMLQVQGGIGAARTSFSYKQSGCVGTAVCTTQTTPVGNANHFQVHAGVGVQIYLTEHVFIRPQFDFHYVPGFTDQFGTTAVPAGMIWIGYSLGERK